MIKLINDVEKFYGPIDVGVFNIGVNIKHNIEDTTSRTFYKLWEMNCYSGFLFGKELALKMRQRGRGDIMFTGATSSIRGNSGFSAFSST